MFIRNYLFSLKQIARNKVLVGWNIIFPLVLATAFYLGFGNLIKDDPDNFSTIEVGYVNTDSSTSFFKDVIDELAQASNDETAILSVHEFTSKEAATAAMNDGQIDGFYIEKEGSIDTIIPANGFNATALNQIVREYKNKEDLITTIAKDHPENLAKIVDNLTEEKAPMKEYSFGNNTSQYMQYFFALLAMSSLFSSWISTAILSGLCANISEQGKRFECAPVNKLSAILAGGLAGLTVQSLSNAIAVIYMEYVLKISFGIPLYTIIFITTLGSGVGISIGLFMGSLIKSQRLLVAVPLVFTMTCSFFSGLMWGQIKQLIEYSFPIFNRINPAALLTDALYIRTTYGATTAYYQCLLIMAAIVIGCTIVSALLLRRRKYVSL